VEAYDDECKQERAFLKKGAPKTFISFYMGYSNVPGKATA
jgi:hypothetical protein